MHSKTRELRQRGTHRSVGNIYIGVLSALPQGKHTGEVGARAGEGSVKVKSVKLDRWRMPLYEYRCRDCGKEFEALILPSFSNVPACPACGSTKLEQLL